MSRLPSDIPLHPGDWLSGSLKLRREDPIRLFTEVGRMGPLSAFRALWIHVLSANTPELVKHILIDRAGIYTKGIIARPFRGLIGDGLLVAEGNPWKRHRRLMQPAFHRDVLGALPDLVTEATLPLLESWQRRMEAGETFDVMPEMMSLTMSVVARALFGTDVTGQTREVREALTFALDEVNARLLSFNRLRPFTPNAHQRTFRRAIATLDRLAFAIIEERRRTPREHRDLLALLMNAKDAETGEALSNQEVRDEVMTLFLAGHETTANALCWLWYLLDQNPQAETNARAEVREVLGGRAPGVADLPKLPLVHRTLEETLRLFPPAWLLARQNQAPDTLGGHAIPKGLLVAICPYVLHRNPAYWPDPERFDPDRFLPEQVAQRPKLAYLPFGAGQRLCIGNSFAMMEAQVILALVLSSAFMWPSPPDSAWSLHLR